MQMPMFLNRLIFLCAFLSPLVFWILVCHYYYPLCLKDEPLRALFPILGPFASYMVGGRIFDNDVCVVVAILYLILSVCMYYSRSCCKKSLIASIMVFIWGFAGFCFLNQGM